jgi:serine/threonine-protein kinase
MTLEIGQVVDNKYRITRLLGQGAMGAVFEGENVRIKRRVAIKVLHGVAAERKDLIDRFEREAQAAGRIGSEHIVEVLDLGELPGGARYLVMEYLEGESLGQRIEKMGRMLPAQALTILRQLLAGLASAHEAGIVHRDLKPDNVFLLKEKAGHKDFVKIVDFGISKFNPLNGEDAKMTQTGAVMGTPYYMSPEQAKGAKTIDHRSDLFSVGIILYELVTGRIPFDGETFNELMFKIALQDPPPPESIVPNLDPGVGRMIRKALARDPEQRFDSARAFIAAIDEWMQGGRSSISVPPPNQVALQQPGVAATQALPQGYQTGAPAGATQAMPPGAMPGAPQMALGKKTQAEWSNSGAAPPPPKDRTGLFVGLGLVLALVGGGGGFAAYKLTSASASESAPTTTDEASKKDEPADAKKDAPAPSAEPAASVEPVASAEPAASASASAEPAANASASAEPAATVAATTAKKPPTTTTNPTTATKPTADTKPTTEPKPTTAPKPATSGRTVRQDI